MKNEVNHLAHSSCRCEYHIVFSLNYWRKAIYGQLKAAIGVILRKLCDQIKAGIIETELYQGHVHILVSITPYTSVASLWGGVLSRRAH